MRHAEVAEPPRHARGKADETRRLRGRGVREERLQIRIDLIERVHRRGETARVADDNRRHQDNCDKHQRTLDEVRPAHRHVPAEQRIADDDERADPETERVASHREPEERNRVRNAEGRREELRTAHEPGRRVEREEHEDDDRRDDARDAGRIAEAVADEVRNRDRIPAGVRIDPESVRHDLPVEVSAHEEPDADPRLGEAADVDGARKAHQQPARHVGGLRRERDHPLVHLAAAEIVVAERLLALGEEKADPEHERKIADE